MHIAFKPTLGLIALTLVAQARAQVTLYEHNDFQGRSYTTEQAVNNFERRGFNDRASSIVVLGERWEVCEDVRFGGHCVVLRPGRYASIGRMDLNDRISSMRPIARGVRVVDERFAADPEPVYDNRRRNRERLFEADVDSVRAVLAVAGQRCWMERESAPPAPSGSNVGGAIAGGLIGGILGHQVGGGVGKDLATVGGAVAGAVIGAQVGRNSTPDTQEVQRCANAPEQARPAYWDVSYHFRGQDHRAQMTTQPGQRITVNAQGEPRT